MKDYSKDYERLTIGLTMKDYSLRAMEDYSKDYERL